MFSIYGISGPVFQGTLETLPRQPVVNRREPVLGVRRVGDRREYGTEVLASFP